MNDKTGGSRGPRRAGALAVLAAVTVLATACGVHVSFSSGSAPVGHATFRENLAFARCMQTHGVPNFPTPTNSLEGFHVSGRVNQHGNGFPGPLGRAYDACQHLLPRGSVTTSNGHVTSSSSTWP